jgi:hypothetical protein
MADAGVAGVLVQPSKFSPAPKPRSSLPFTTPRKAGARVPANATVSRQNKLPPTDRNTCSSMPPAGAELRVSISDAAGFERRRGPRTAIHNPPADSSAPFAFPHRSHTVLLGGHPGARAADGRHIDLGMSGTTPKVVKEVGPATPWPLARLARPAPQAPAVAWARWNKLPRRQWLTV